jgi:hypothetical protein
MTNEEALRACTEGDPFRYKMCLFWSLWIDRQTGMM